MGRTLRLLAIGAIIFDACAALLTIPPGVFPQPLERQLSAIVAFDAHGLLVGVLTNSGTLLAVVMGTLAIFIAFRRGQRAWLIVFVLLVLLGAYSSLLLEWVRTSRTAIYDPDTFTINLTAIYLIKLLPQIISAVLAIVVLIYSYRHRQVDVTDAQLAA